LTVPTQHLARELAPYRINVNAASPGIVDTPMVAAALTPEQLQKLAASIPFERLAAPAEIASLVAFLVSDERPISPAPQWISAAAS